MESVKIRSPAGVAPQGHLWWSVVPVGSNAWVRGLPGYGQVSQECFRKILCHTWGSRSFIWKAALRLLTTSSNWTIFFPFVCRPAALAQLHICVDGTLKTAKVPDSFLSLLFSLRFFCLFLFLSSQLERFSVLVLSVSPCRFPLVKC